MNSFVETIIDYTLKLLIMVGDEKNTNAYMTPSKFISLIDIQANWFTKWMV
jgi:hypothetical protein